MLGGHVESFEVTPRPEAMLAQRIGLRELRGAIAQNNQNDGAGRLVDGEEVLLVRSEGSIRTLEELRAVVVRSHPVEPVRVGDIAEVQLGSLERYGGVTRDGDGEVVQGLVLALRGANAEIVVKGVRAKLADLAPSLPEGVEVRVFYDRGELVRTAVGAVQWALFSAVVLVIAVLMAFLADWRAALTVALVLPLSVLATFIWMRQFGLSANLMSLGGLATVDSNGSMRGFENTCHQLKQRGLPTSAGSDQSNELPGIDLKIDVLNGKEAFTEMLGNTGKRDHCNRFWRCTKGGVLFWGTLHNPA